MTDSLLLIEAFEKLVIAHERLAAALERLTEVLAPVIDCNSHSIRTRSVHVYNG